MVDKIPYRELKPGQQINIDLKDATQKICDCGCELFLPLMKVFTVSALVSPMGKELVAQVPALICWRCEKELKIS